MATIADLSAKLTLNSTGFTAGAEKAERAALALEKRLQKQTATFGQSSAAVRAYELVQNGASAETVARVQALDKQIKAQNDQAAAIERGKAVVQSTRTPLEQYKSSVASLSALLKKGAIDQDTYNRAVMQAQGSLNASSAAQNKTNISLLKGAGAAAALTFTARSLSNGLDRIKETQTAVASGGLRNSEAFVEYTAAIFRAVPVAGEFVDVGEKLTSVFTGLDEAISEDTRRLQNRQAAIEAQTRATEVFKKATTDAASIIASMTDQRRLAAASSYGPAALIHTESVIQIEHATNKVTELKAALESLPDTGDFSGERSKLFDQITQLETLAKTLPAIAQSNVIGELQAQLDLFGKSSDDLARMKLEALGASQGALALADSIIAQRRALESASAARLEAERQAIRELAIDDARRKSIESTIKSLERQAILMGKSGAEIVAYDLAVQGATESDIARAVALQKQIQAFDDLANSQGDAIRATEKAITSRGGFQLVDPARMHTGRTPVAEIGEPIHRFSGTADDEVEVKGEVVTLLRRVVKNTESRFS